MTEFAARIRRIRMHDGADVHVLRNPMPDAVDGDHENWRGKLVEHAKAIGAYDEEGKHLDGYIVIGFFSDGATSTAMRMPERLPRCLAPAYVAELVRRDVVTELEAERVFNRKFEWVE